MAIEVELLGKPTWEPEAQYLTSLTSLLRSSTKETAHQNLET